MSHLGFDEFEEILINMQEEEIEIGRTKGREYGLTSRLSNFTRLGDELGIDAKVVLWIYLKKHLDAILSYITTGGKTYSESISGRILDGRVYLSLLQGLIIEEAMEKKRINEVKDRVAKDIDNQTIGAVLKAVLTVDDDPFARTISDE